MSRTVLNIFARAARRRAARPRTTRRRFFKGAAAAAALAVLAAVAVAALGGSAASAAKKLKPATEGSLRVVGPDGEPVGLCPLRHTAVRATVSGFISRVTVTQEFRNPFPEKIEAVYVFPLPQGAAVDDLTMRVGDRTIKGRIMRREEARTTYEQAKERGQVASLLDQERPNIFTQSVANIPPGEEVTVVISYVETLKYEDGLYEWSFPMTVGERYIPAAAGTPKSGEPKADGGEGGGAARESDAARISPPRVPKGQRAGHDVSVEVLLDAGVPVGAIKSTTHEVEVERADERRAAVRLKDKSTIPNKDFVLRFDSSGAKIEDAVLAHRNPADARGGFFTLILQPPDRVAAADVTPKELVFVLDTSGSMEGFPLDRAKQTLKLALDGLYPQDTFNLITFSGDDHVLFPEPVQATPDNLRLAKKFLSGREGGGGTEMMKAVRSALEPSDSRAHVRIACFMTDGHVGNDYEIIAEVQKHPNARVFAMGFGDAPNRFLLDKMAEEGRGEAVYVADGDDDPAIARRFHERVRNPLLTDLSVEWSGLDIEDVYPRRIPDLFGARPVTLSGRYARGGRGKIVLRGRAAGREFAREIAVELPDVAESHGVLATLWARRRVDDLTSQDFAGAQLGDVRPDLRDEITRLGLDFRLMTQFTSFVAVDESSATGEGKPRRVDVPAESPAAGVGYNTGGGVVQVSGGGAGGGGGGGHVGAVSEMVMVTSSAETTLESHSSSTATVTSRSIYNLPLNGRNALDLLTLAPGTTSNGANQSLVSGEAQPAANGQRPRSNTLMVDGVGANLGGGGGARTVTQAGASAGSAAYGGAGSLVSGEGVEELSINTRPVLAEYGRSTGAQVSVVTKSGTNEFRGSLYERFGHDRLDASDWFADRRGLADPRHRQNLFGATLGGPVKRDQTFFFASYEGLRLRQPSFGVTDVPALEARSGAPPELRALLEAFPLPNGPARADSFAEFSSSYSNPARLDAFSLRADSNVTDRLTLFARYGQSASSAAERGAGYALSTLAHTRAGTQTLTAGFRSHLSSSVVAEARANFSRATLGRTLALDDFGGALVPADSSLFPPSFARADGSSVFDLAGRNAALASGGETFAAQRQLNLVGAVSAVRGAHTLKLGADYRRLFPVVDQLPFERNVLFNGVAEALAGTAARQSLYARERGLRPVFNSLSLYAQDDWRLSSRLNVSYGLRWELSPAPSAGDGRDPLAVAGAPDPSRLVLAPRGARLWETTYGNFAPRAGFAYELSNKSGAELTLRGGFGLFYDSAGGQAAEVFGDSLPFLAARTVFDAPFPAFADDAAAATQLDPAAPSSAPFAAFDPHLRLPYSLQWNVSAERGLGSHQSVWAAYVGTAGRRLLVADTYLDPSPDFAFVRLTTNGASSRYHALQLGFTRRLAGGLSGAANYTFSKSTDDASQDSLARTLLRATDRRGERGPSDFDVRHTFAANVSYELPSPFGAGPGRALFGGWSLDAIFGARSARPVNVVYWVPTAYGFAYLRPDVVGGVPLVLRDPSEPGGWRINPAAFTLPAGARQGTLGRNSLRGFAFSQLDVALRREFKRGDRLGLQLGAEVFNLLDRANFEDPAGADVSLGGRLSPAGALRANATFGRSASLLGRGPWANSGGFASFNGAGGPRTVQLSLRLEF